MPILTLTPTRPGLVHQLRTVTPAVVRAGLKGIVLKYSGYTEDDVLVNFEDCSNIDTDPYALDWVLTVEICPSPRLEAVSNPMRDELLAELANLGFSDAEVWVQVHYGPWGMIRGGVVVDTVDHPRLIEPAVQPSDPDSPSESGLQF